MSKENTSKKNILDYDEDKTIRPQNFTLTAMKEFYDTIESDQFQGASEDTIYKYLTNIMEIVSFKDFLRRYIYEYAGIKENFNQVTNYPELLLEIFARNDCYDLSDAEEKKKLKKKANRWLTSESVKRENMFYIGFGLDMNDKQISEFLTLVLKEPDFDFTSPSETIYWHCRYNGKSWMEAQKLLEAYEKQAEDLIQYIENAAKSPEGVWSTSIFGKSIEELVMDGMRNKIMMINDESQAKLQDTMQKIVNDSKGGLVCIII